MKVKQLIAELKKCPSNAEVYYSHGDNSQYEIAGECVSVWAFDREEILADSDISDSDRRDAERLPAKSVVIRG